METEIIKLGNREWSLNRDILKYNESNINQFLTEFAALYDYYSEAQCMAQANADNLKAKYEQSYEQKFMAYKEDGATEKLANAKATINPDVVSAHEAFITANFKARRLYGWLRSMDKAYESAKEFCYNLRKELDKIYGSSVRELHDKMF